MYACIYIYTRLYTTDLGELAMPRCSLPALLLHRSSGRAFGRTHGGFPHLLRIGSDDRDRSQIIHGAGIFTYKTGSWGFYVGKYTSTMDDLGIGCNMMQL